jgi:GAF domain-containing protein
MPQPTKQQRYQSLCDEMEHLLEGEQDFVVNAALASSLVYYNVPGLLWAGFYVRRGDELVVGPFQGRPALSHIPLGKGVSGTAAARADVIAVDDLRAAGGSTPNNPNTPKQTVSQIAVPLLYGPDVVGVLQLDSHLPGRFDDEDRDGLQRVARLFVELTDFG